MSDTDLILLHAPSVYDFRKHITLWGPIGDLVPSDAVFEMYPIGFTSMAEYLERYGLQVRIINLAVRMLRQPDFDVNEFLAELDARAFGIDLHWLPHAHGAIEIARLLKKHHPHTPIIMGGYSASYFHQELIQYPCVDYILRGDSTEEPLYQLISSLQVSAQERTCKSIPNLVWKDRSGLAHINPIRYVPDNLDDIFLDYRFVLNAVAREREMRNYLPFAKWTKYPITAALTCRGCTRRCAFCGGSAYAGEIFLGRHEPAYRDPVTVAQDLRRINRFSRGPVFVIGDIRQPGKDYAERFLDAIAGFNEQVILEFFSPVSADFMQQVAEALPNFVVELSPESHDPQIRARTGKGFSDLDIRDSVENILSANAKRVDVFFMTGLPYQTAQSVDNTITYCEAMLKAHNGDPRLKLFISPLAPFLDPGSLAYEHPKQYGYTLLCKTLEDHRQALLAPSWKYVLNYETRWMSRDEMVTATYLAGLRLNRLKAEFGQISSERAELTEQRIMQAVKLMDRIDGLVEKYPMHDIQQHLAGYSEEIQAVNYSTVCEKEELDLPVEGAPVKWLQALGMLIEDSLDNIFSD